MSELGSMIRSLGSLVMAKRWRTFVSKRGAGAPANSAGEQLIGAGANHEKLARRYFGEVADIVFPWLIPGDQKACFW